MSFGEAKVPTPAQSTSRWFLFLTFYHLLPVVWFLAVAGGLAPASFLLAGGVASLFSRDTDSIVIAAFLLAPALLGGLVLYFIAWLLASLIGRLHRPLIRTLSLLAIFGICLVAAMQPVFVSGGHRGSHAYSFFEFVEVLEEFGIPSSLATSYFAGLGLLLLGLLIHQHRVAHRQTISVQKWLHRRRFRRRILVAGVIGLLLSLSWTHRTPLFIKPMADLGVPAAQYQLAMVLKEQSIARHGRPSGYQDWLVRAAEQGHLKAAQALVLHPRNQEEKLRWLTVAAEGGMAEAQYALYRELLKATPGVESSRGAADWLQAAAGNNQVEAQFELGRAHLVGNSALKLERNPAQARRWLEQAAHNGHGQALKELAWRYEKAADGFPRDAQRAIELYEQLAEGYRTGVNGLKQDAELAADQLARGRRLANLEARLAASDPQVQSELGRELLQVAGGMPETRADGLELLEQAANGGAAQLQYELGGIFLFGRHDQPIDLPRGRSWWAKSLAQNHIKTMESVAPAYQDGRFGYPIDLLRSRALVLKLVEAYRDGAYGVDPDPAKLRRWKDELTHLDRLFELAGGNYQSPTELQGKAEAGDSEAQYRLGRQMLVSGPHAQRQKGLQWIERAANGGHTEAQYRLVTYFENQAGIMRSDPARGVALLAAAAQQNHLPAAGALALGYEKGRNGLPRDLRQAQLWYQRLLQAYEEGNYTGEVTERFIPFNRQRLVYVSKALENEIEKTRRYEAASPLERQIIEVEDRYRQQYQDAVNALPRDDGSREGKRRFRANVQMLLQQFHRLRDAEIARLKDGD